MKPKNKSITYSYKTQVMALARALDAAELTLSHLQDCHTYEQAMAPYPWEEYDELLTQAQALQSLIKAMKSAVFELVK